MAFSVLLVDDNEEILSANAAHMESQGFEVVRAATGNEALTLIRERSFDCMVLDILLPDVDGFSLCKAARAVTDTPILFLSCLDEADDKVKGLMYGGDDYMSKPYSLKELAARIHALIRRNERLVMASGDFYIDYENRIIHANGKNMLLTEREFNLFLLFYRNPNKILSKENILEQIWKGNAEIGTVAVLVLKLRRKIKFAEDFIGVIENSYSTGYVLVSPAAEAVK